MSRGRTTIAHYVGPGRLVARAPRSGAPGAAGWRAVLEARPLFLGHHQPRLPADLGFYDLQLREVRDQQVQLAQQHGIDAFCYRYRWQPGAGPDALIHNVVNEKSSAMEFCLAWEAHQGAASEQHARFLSRAMRHPRYLRLNGQPVLFIHRLCDLTGPAETLRRWRQLWAHAGIPTVHVVRLDSVGDTGDPAHAGADAAAQFLPHTVAAKISPVYPPGCSPGLRVLSYAELMETYLHDPPPQWIRYESVIPGWDDSGHQNAAESLLVHGGNPDLYERWLRTAHARADADGLVLINAWNDWNNAAYLEPDLTSSQSYLHATARATGADIAAIAPWDAATAELLGLQYA